MRSLLSKVRGFIRNEEGIETVEYAIITALIVAATIGVISAIGVWVLAIYQSVLPSP